MGLRGLPGDLVPGPEPRALTQKTLNSPQSLELPVVAEKLSHWDTRITDTQCLFCARPRCVLIYLYLKILTTLEVLLLCLFYT